MKTPLLFFSLLLIPSFLFCQFETDFVQLGNEGSEDVIAVFPDNQEGYWAAGTFSSTLEIGNTFTSEGETDIWIGKWTDTNVPISFFTIGSSRGDELLECKQLENGNLFLSGYFFQTLQLPDTTLDAGNAIKAVFLLELDQSGHLIRHRILTGTGQKEIGKVTFTDKGLLIAGSFSSDLSAGSLTVSASGLEDAFILGMDNDWNPSLLKNFQSAGRAVGRSFFPVSKDTFLFTGHFNGNIQLDTINLLTSTPDFDLFVSRVDSAGNVIAARRLGGVYDAKILTAQLYADSLILFTGTHRGVINLDDQSRIQTQGFNDNFFAFALRKNGEVVWGRSLGGGEDENLQNASLSSNDLFLVGFGQGGFEIDGESFQKGPGFSHGFLISLHPYSGSLQWYSNLQGNEFVISKTVGWDDEGNTYWGLSFSKELYANNGIQTSRGFYDVVFGRLRDGLSFDEEVVNNFAMTTFPNPFVEYFQVKGLPFEATLSLYDQQGKEVPFKFIDDTIHLKGPSGIYFLKVVTEKNSFIKKLVKTN